MVMLPSPTSSSSHAPLLFSFLFFLKPSSLSSFYVRFLLLEKERKTKERIYNGVSTSLLMIFFLFPSCSSSPKPFSFLSSFYFGFVFTMEGKGEENGFYNMYSY